MPGKRSVLIIEDDIPYGEMLQDAMRHFGYDTSLAYSATGGLDLVSSQDIEVIISDISMPGINGIELAARLLKTYPDVPIVLMSSHNDFALVRQALALGVSDFLVKPVQISDLPVVIEKSMERKRLEKVQQRTTQEESLLDTLQALLHVLDARDARAGEQTRQVAKLTLLFAEYLQMDSKARYELKIAAYLHDISKIGLPDRLLKKVEGSTGEDFDNARNRPLLGSRIIRDMPGLECVEAAVRHQYECFDGSGYPDGLTGTNIPQYSRILAIVTAYDRLSGISQGTSASDRQAILAEIEQQAGKHYDPYLVEQFHAMFQRAAALESRQSSHQASLEVNTIS